MRPERNVHNHTQASGGSRLGWLPCAGLLLALSAVFFHVGEADHFYRSFVHDSNSAKNMALVENLSLTKGFLFLQTTRGRDGAVRHMLYNRFPIGGFVLIKLAIAPFEGDLSAQITSARVLMLAFFCAAAILAYSALVRLLGDVAVALTATLLAFSSYYMLDYNDIISNEISMDLCAVLLVFHGMVVFAQEHRFGQLLAKTGAALLIGWHVYALLLPFIAIGLASELASASRQAAAPAGKQLVALFAIALRSRHVLLGLLALFFGGAMVAYNLAQESAVFGGERSLSELPSARSFMRRAGVDASFNAGRAEWLAWPNFLKWQFHRVGGMSLPYLLPAPRNDLAELPQELSGAASLVWVGVAMTAACLIGVCAVRRRRTLLALLPLVGFVWALPLRSQTGIPGHDHEAVFYVGVPLVVFALLLLGARKLAERCHERLGRYLTAGIAIATVPGFASCAFAMAAAGRDADTAHAQRALIADFEAIRDTTRGHDVLVAANRDALDRLFKVQSAFYYYMAGSILGYEEAHIGAAPARATPARRTDFVLAMRRLDSDSLRTPGNRFVFLYDSRDALDALAAARRSDYAAVAATAPLARSVWQLHMRDNARSGETELVYRKDSCRRDDINGRFSLHIYPVRAGDLSPQRRPAGFDVIAFGFGEYGVVVDDKCLVIVPLPKYQPAWMATRYVPDDRGGAGWETSFRLDVDSLRRAYESTRTLPAIARSIFDVHHQDGRLVYTQSLCGADDVRARFFLHVTPSAVRDLPKTRRRHGFDNLDFNFHERGTVLPGGTCVAVVPLPEHPIAGVVTGQFAANGHVAWQTEFGIE